MTKWRLRRFRCRLQPRNIRGACGPRLAIDFGVQAAFLGEMALRGFVCGSLPGTQFIADCLRRAFLPAAASSRAPIFSEYWAMLAPPGHLRMLIDQ